MACPVRPLRALLAVVLVAGLVLASVAPARATNATNLLGYSAASQGMAGAGSVALTDISIINTNIATLSLMPNNPDRDPDSAISGGFAGFNLGVLQPYLHHTDVFGERGGENNPFIAIHGGAAFRLRSLPQVTFGLGVFSQSGLGSEFKGLRTAFGTSDEITSYERFVKLQSAISYEVVDGFSLAIGPYLGYADLTLQMFPRTSAPAAGFFGLAIGDRCARNYGVGEPGSDCPWTVVGGVKVATTWRITPQLTAGVVYTSPGSFAFDHGEGRVDFTSLGLGRVKYDVSVSGITHPQNVQMGFAFRPFERLLLALDLTWHDWSVFRGFTIKLRHPDTPGAPKQIDLFTREDWRDQFVIALGAAYELIPGFLTVRGGYNYANNPSPSATFTPAIQVPFEHHLATGAGLKLGKRWEVDGGFIWGFEKKVTYTNNSLPFGPDATEKPSGFSVDVTVGYRF